MKLKNCPLWLSAACGLAFSSAWAQTPDVLLLINDSDPAAITITATTNDSTASDSSHTFTDGVDLAGFFTGAVDAGSEFAKSTLTTFRDGAPAGYFGDTSNNLQDPGASTGADLALFTPDTSNIEHFVAGSQAFSGTATFELSNVAASLPAAGTLGNGYAGNAGDEGSGGSGVVLIGAYEVVPEPSSGLLLLLLLAGVALLAGRQVRLFIN